MRLVKDITTQIVNVYDERITLDINDIKAAQQWYANNAQGCIDEAVSGEVFVNDIDIYVRDKQQDKANYITGNFEPSLGFWQTAIYLKTKQSVPILS